MAEPDLEFGIKYWTRQPASLDGVLGGFGSGSLPRIDALGSRLFLLNVLPELFKIPSALRPLAPPRIDRRTRALDVGAGIGRVTADVLLHLIDDVVLVEPVEPFVREAYTRGSASHPPNGWKGIADRSTSVTFIQATLQSFDPSIPLGNRLHTRIGRVGYTYTPESDSDMDSGFDVIWCQWCLGHLSDRDLVAFFRRCKLALRGTRCVVVVKENVCADGRGGKAHSELDEEDSSLTRSDLAWKQLFAEADLSLFRERVQLGLPQGLYTVKMYALR